MESKCKAAPVAGLGHAPGPSQPCFEPGRAGTAVHLHTKSESPHQQTINYTEVKLSGALFVIVYPLFDPKQIFPPPLPIYLFSFFFFLLSLPNYENTD